MYGLILQGVQDYVVKKFGAKVWQEVLYVSGVEEGNFSITQNYPEAYTYKLLFGARDVLAISNEDLMRQLGTDFYTYISRYEYHKVLRILGRTFPAFLNALDNLHEYMMFTYPALKSPSFYCEHESRTGSTQAFFGLQKQHKGLTLHYRSKRRGFMHYVRGQIENIAMKLYNIQIKVELLDHEREGSLEHTIMRLHFNNYSYIEEGPANEEQVSLISEIKITADTFFDTFPFMIVFNRGMRVRNVGLALLRGMPQLVGKKVNHCFVMIRPLLKFRWEQLMSHSNSIFEIMSIDTLKEIAENKPQTVDISELDEQLNFIVTEDRRRMNNQDRQHYFSLKGPMMYIEEWESICFLAVPVMQNLKQLYRSSLFINDFAMHDSSRDLVLANTQQAAELRLLLSKEAEKAAAMQHRNAELQAERQRTDEIVYQLLPRSVADKLRMGADALSTCQNFASVTILFTDIVGFTTICSKIQPIDVVNLLTEMYGAFDEITDAHGVFKVETIGDAYVAVGGAPTETRFHAELTVDCAIDLVDAVRPINVNNGADDVRIRCGVHTGPVVAGVVGIKMPRYCLFGDTVLIANKMESTGTPMQVQISESTKKALDVIDAGLFNLKPNKEVDVKENFKLRTFLVESKNGESRLPDEHVSTFQMLKEKTRKQIRDAQRPVSRASDMGSRLSQTSDMWRQQTAQTPPV